MRYRSYILILLSLVCTNMYAKDKFTLDKVLQWPVIGVVYPSLSPETGIAIGAGIQGTWNMPEEKTPSSLRLTGCYTQYNQWKVQVAGSFYMAGNTPWVLHYTLLYRDYPDKYFGTGNQLEHTEMGYGSKRFSYTLEPLFRLPKHWNVGPMMDFLWEQNNLQDQDSLYDGTYRTLMWGLGLSTQYDTRDILHYPTRGMLLNVKGFYCEPALGADCRLWKMDVDFRHYITLWKPTNVENDFQRVNGSLIFAYQVRFQSALTNGNNEAIPFQMLPTLGGDEMLRGIRANMFRDNTLLALQTELRFPIYRVVHGTAFAGIGDVYNTQHWNWAVPKVGYGLGLRVTINRAHVNVRFDVARNNINTSWKNLDSYSFYVTASEAF